MSYAFELIGVTPVLSFFNQQQQFENQPQRSRAYLGSYACTLDAFIESTQLIHDKPDWNWSEVIDAMVGFWLHQEDSIRHWRYELEKAGNENIMVARVVNMTALRDEFETLFDQ
jgi:hypothetical protein